MENMFRRNQEHSAILGNHRWWQLIVLACILTACSEDEGGSTAKTSGPQMHAAVLEHDFGSVFTGVVKKATFQFENRGSSDLVIARALKDCGCTQPSFSKKRLAPGESAIMTVTLLAPLYHGQMNKRIRVFTNDPNNEVTTFYLKLIGLGKASLSPQVVQFGKLTTMDGPELVRSFDLELPPGQPVLGISLNAETPYVRANLVKVNSNGKSQFDLVFSDLRETIKFRDYLLLTIETVDANGKTIRIQPQGIQINGYLAPKVSASKTMINLGVVRPGHECPVTLDVRTAEDTSIESVSLFSTNNGMRLGKSKSAALQVSETLALSHQPGRHFGTLKILLKGGAEIEIPILAWVEPRT